MKKEHAKQIKDIIDDVSMTLTVMARSMRRSTEVLNTIVHEMRAEGEDITVLKPLASAISQTLAVAITTAEKHALCEVLAAKLATGSEASAPATTTTFEPHKKPTGVN